jgi:hypothetical protein
MKLVVTIVLIILQLKSIHMTETDQISSLENFHTEKSPLWKLLYSTVVAGKSAKFACNVMGRLDKMRGNIPIIHFFEIYDVELVCRQIKTGNYNKITKCWNEILDWFRNKSDINWSEVSPLEIELIHGIGPKTSRFFLLWMNKNAEYAALDTHILKWMKSKGHDVPRSTPPSKKYLTIEQYFIREAKLRNMTPAELDWKIWDAYAHKKEIPQ